MHSIVANTSGHQLVVLHIRADRVIGIRSFSIFVFTPVGSHIAFDFRELLNLREYLLESFESTCHKIIVRELGILLALLAVIEH